MHHALFIFALSAMLFLAPPHASAQEGLDRQTPEEIEAIERQLEIDFGKSEPFADEESPAILSQYSHIDRNRVVPRVLLDKALAFFHANKSAFRNQRYISVVDFSRRSNLPRFFIINMNDGSVTQLRTTHGAGSDRDDDGYAESFGNVSNSHKSSLGFYKVAEDYHGAFGHSIRMDGLSSTNSNVRARAIVVHGYDQTWERNVKQGLSFGCIAVAWSVRDMVVEKLKGGSLLYAGLSNE